MNRREELTARVAKLDREIADIKAVDTRAPNVVISGNTFSGDTAKLLIGCTINALSSQRENYLAQLIQELNIRSNA